MREEVMRTKATIRRLQQQEAERLLAIEQAEKQRRFSSAVGQRRAQLQAEAAATQAALRHRGSAVGSSTRALSSTESSREENPNE
jgi:hypothetical protein